MVNETRTLQWFNITDKHVNKCIINSLIGHITLLTLVAVEVAGDVDAFASYHHHFVS